MKLSKAIALTAISTMMSFQIGCTDREVASGAAGAVIGAILVDSASRAPAPRPVARHCSVRQVERCGYYRTYGGGSVYRCSYQTIDSCSGRYRLMGDISSPLDVTDVSQLYELQPASASKFILALNQAEKASDDASAAAAWAQIGVDLQEAKSFGTSGSFSANQIDKIAQALDQDTGLTQRMVEKLAPIARELAAGKSQSESPYIN